MLYYCVGWKHCIAIYFNIFCYISIALNNSSIFLNRFVRQFINFRAFQTGCDLVFCLWDFFCLLICFIQCLFQAKWHFTINHINTESLLLVCVHIQMSVFSLFYSVSLHECCVFSLWCVKVKGFNFEFCSVYLRSEFRGRISFFVRINYSLLLIFHNYIFF